MCFDFFGFVVKKECDIGMNAFLQQDQEVVGIEPVVIGLFFDFFLCRYAMFNKDFI